MQVEVDLKRMQANFGGCGFPGFGDMAPFLCLQKFPFEPWAIVNGGQKNRISSKIHTSRG